MPHDHRALLTLCVLTGWTSCAYGQRCAYSEAPVVSCGFPRVIPGTPGQHVVYVDTTDSTTSGALCSPSISVTNLAWFEVRPTARGPLTFTACHPLTTYDTVIAAYSGGNNECQGMIEVDCNDDYNFNDPACDNACGTRRSSTVTIPDALAGARYRFAVGEYAGAAGCTNCLGAIVTIGTPCGDPPTNLVCGLAKEIPGNPGTHEVLVDVSDAPDNIKSISCEGLTPTIGHSVWFRFTPTVDGMAAFSTCHSNTTYDTVVRAVTGCSGLTSQLVCNDDTAGGGCSISCPLITGERTSDISFAVSAGVEYFVEVGAYDNNSSGCSLCLGAYLTISECAQHSDCDDGNPCTQDSCDVGVCTNAALSLGAPCPDDGNECTADFCSHGACTHPVATNGFPCGSGANTDCDNPDTCRGGSCQRNFATVGTVCAGDGNDCTDDVCNGSGACTHPNSANGSSCGSGVNTDCDNPDSCFNGVCLLNYASSGVGCSADTNACTLDICNGLGACTHPAGSDGTSCGSASSTPCDNPDRCRSGICDPNYTAAGSACPDDGNECTNDRCNGSGSCAHPSKTDGTACGSTGVSECDLKDSCLSGTCVPNLVPAGTPCAGDGNECTTDVCSGTGSCVHAALPDGTPCGDGANECMETRCLAGNCARTSLPAGTLCGNSADNACDGPDSCDGVGACSPNYAPRGTRCSDAAFCNGDEICNGGGACLPGTPPCPPGVACSEEEWRCITGSLTGQCQDPATDTNGDNRVDHEDFADFLPCFFGPTASLPIDPPWCLCVDLDDNGHVDMRDQAIWQRCFRGAALPADRGCDGAPPERLRPDQRARLAVTALKTNPVFPAVGEPVDVSVEVRNLASQVAPAVAVAFSADGAPADLQRVDLPAGSVRTLHFQWTPNTPGTHALGAVVDPAGEFLDNDRIDNAASISVHVSDPPPTDADFALTSLSVIALPGRPVAPRVTLVNNGGAAGESVFVLRADGRTITTRLIRALASGESITIDLSWPVGLPLGRMTGEINPRYRGSEGNPDDNLFTQDFSSPVDLRLENLTVQALRLEPPRPQRATVSFRVVNGSSDPVTTPFTTTIDLGPVGTYQVQSPGVAGKETVYISRTVIVQSIEPGFDGQFNIRVEADSGHVIAETDEGNNVATSHFSQSPPDIGHWTAIGPRNMFEGLGASGRLQRIAVTPTTGEPGSLLTMYVGAPSGSSGQPGGCGVWKSVDSGRTWAPVSDSFPSLSIVGLAIDPAVRTRVFAFTIDQGIFQTEDGGISWHRISTQNIAAHAGDVGGPYVDPSNSDRIFVATTGGVRRSTDRGKTWPIVLASGSSVAGLLMDPANPNHLYASLRDDKTLSRTGIWETWNGGDRWDQLTGCPDGRLPTITEPTTIRIAQSGSHLYASYSDSKSWRFYFTTNIGCSIGGRGEQFWQAGWNPPDCTQPCTTTRSLLWSSIYADPVDPNYVYASGTRFFVSSDGGKNFTAVSNTSGPHDDHHGMAFDPWNPAHIFVVCDGGIYSSTNRGAANSWEFIGDGIVNVEFFDIANARTEPNLITGGTQDNGTLLFDGSNLKWSWIKGGDGGTVDIDPTNPQILYAMNQFSCSLGRKIGTSRFDSIACQLPTNCFNLYYQVHPTSPTTVLASCEGSLWRSANPVCTEAPNCNNGTTGQPQKWSRIFTPPVADGGVVRSTVDAAIDLYYAGTGSGRIFAGPAGADFKLVFRHPAGSGVSDIEVDPDNPTVVYATFGGGGERRVYRIVRTSAQPTEATVLATPIGDNLDVGLFLRTVAVDRLTPFTIYVGTSKGVYRGRSTDNGLTWTWTVYNEGMPPAVDVKDLVVHPTTGVIRAGTLGRSAYEVQPAPPVGSQLAAEGRLTLLRVHDVGTGFGPAGDVIDGEVIVRLDTQPTRAFGFTLRNNGDGIDHAGMLRALRSAFRRDRRVRLEYVRTGFKNGRIFRVMLLP